MPSEFAPKVRKNAQHRKYLKDRRKTGGKVADVTYELLESWIRVVKPTTNDHAHDNVGHTRRNQLSHVKRTTLLLSHFADHLFHFHQDPCLHHTLTESKPLQDRQTQLMMATKLSVVVCEWNSLKHNTESTNYVSSELFNVNFLSYRSRHATQCCIMPLAERLKKNGTGKCDLRNQTFIGLRPRLRQTQNCKKYIVQLFRVAFYHIMYPCLKHLHKCFVFKHCQSKVLYVHFKSFLQCYYPCSCLHCYYCFSRL